MARWFTRALEPHGSPSALQGASARRAGVLAASASAIAFALMSFLVHAGREALSSQELALWRALFGAVVLLPVVRPELGRLLSLRARFLWLRSLAGAGSMLCYFWSLQHTSVATARALADLSPLFIAALSWSLLRERLHAREGIGIAVAVSGAALLNWAGRSAPSPHVLAVGALGALFMATAFVSLRKAALEYSIALVVWCFSAVAAAAAGLAMLAEGARGFSARPTHVPLLLGIGLTGLGGQLLLTRAFTHLKASVASALGLTVLLWGLALEYLFEGTVPDARAWPAYGLIVLGAWLVQAASARERAPVAEALAAD